ncbi:MAG TPA: class I SAM-dependent methyltransferase [Paraburkholderia sp.]|jgi:SAM-dependent methyltransferase|nr:class I SAM-dependent methyltransferase [Paraburkholderia sp.]
MQNDFAYTGTDLLVSTEDALSNYNKWIVRMFTSVAARFNACRVLDFGAGVGSLATIFRDETGTVPETLEIDPAQRDILAERGFNPVAGIDELGNGIDFVYTSNVLEHIPDDVDALQKLRSHMNANGRIAIYVPAFMMIWSSLDDKVGHQRRYTKHMLTEHLRRAGFEVETIRYCDSVGFMLALLFRFIGNSSGEPSRSSLVLFDRFLLPVSRAIDLVASPFFGKNVFAVARLA